MKKIALFLAFSFSILSNVSAQSKQESIKELFHLMQQDSLMDKMFNRMLPAMISQMQSNMEIDSAAKEQSTKMMTSMMETMKSITKRMLDEDMVALYSKYFTQSEIDAYISFYKTPAGQKMIKVMPELQQEIMMITMQKYLPEIQQKIKEQTEELIKSKNK